MWVYCQESGELYDSDTGEHVGQGYAGHGVGQNNPEAQDQHNTGPLPCGLYTISPPVDTALHGPYVLWLTPDPSNQMFQRGDFGIHGDSLKHPGQASHGCIVMPHATRVRLWESGDHQLIVIAKE